MKLVNETWLPDDDTHFQRYAEAGAYQQPVFAQAMQLVRHRRWALDIGAHVGFWSRVMAPAFDRVDAFEPVPSNVECLRKNVPETVNIHPFALGSWTGTVGMVTPSSGNSGAWEVDPVYDDVDQLNVPVRMLDDFRLWTRGDVDLVKIDVQGMEFAVLSGARETLTRARPVVVVEIVCHGQLADNVLAWMHNVGAVRIGAYKADWIFGWPTQ